MSLNGRYELISETQSLCPECMSRIPARKIAENGNIYLEKVCPRHGYYKVLIWRQDKEHYLEWDRNNQKALGPIKTVSQIVKGCPYDCGLCSDHQTSACTMVMEVTSRCNLNCPVCFASAGGIQQEEPDLETIKRMYETVIECTGFPTIQLSGGEPTLRNDLPEIVSLGRKMGFTHIMINSNGLRIAKDKEYLKRLADSGVSAIYLQFDGVSDDVYQYTRGANLFKYKVDAVLNCAEVKLGVVLVPTILPGVNNHQVGEIVRFAAKHIPAVRGVHFQPVSYLGRYPGPPEDKDRMTIPDLIDGLVSQTEGMLKEEYFIPGRGSDSHCSFNSIFLLEENGKLSAVTHRTNSIDMRKRAAEETARSFMNLHWRYYEEKQAVSSCCCASSPEQQPNHATELYGRIASRGLTITCMPFQDIWSIDLERLKKCCGHLVTASRRIIPFCAYYLTDTSGTRLYADSEKGGRSIGNHLSGTVAS